MYTTIGIAACIVALAVIIVIKRQNDKITKDVNGNPVISEAENKELDAKIAQAMSEIDFSNFDTDGDGVPDWKEYVYDLNPGTGQTFGEGTSDNILVENLANSANVDGSVYAELTPTPTDVFAQNLYKLSQRAQTPEQVQQIGDQLVESVKTMDLSPDLTKKDIKYASDYKDSYNIFIAQTASILSEQKIFDIKQVVQAEDLESQEVIDKAYELKNVLNNYVAVLKMSPPPEAWIDAYLKILNTASELNQKLYYIANPNNDTVSTLSAISGLQTTVNDFMLAKQGMLQLMYQYVQKETN